MGEEQPGRRELAEWREEMSSSYFGPDSNLLRALERRVGRDRLDAMLPGLAAFGTEVAQVVEPAVVEMERYRDLPAVRPYDGVGQETVSVDFHPAHQRAGTAVWASGLLAVQGGGGGAFEQVALFYLLSHVGEGGHACPAVCTSGLARAIEHRGSADLRDRYLAGLLSTDYRHALRGSQFLTEVQGGSDVGANTTSAVPDSGITGAWRISGEKWFCSVADADLFAVTARPVGAAPGTRGLGCFLLPRVLDDGRPNGFRIRRLKDKLGTRALASAEIEFDGALAWPIGPLDEGFHVAVEELLNTSRWLNAVGSTGIMRRAYLEAASFARHRRAFGVPIGSFPIVREQLALMKAEEEAALASTLALTGLVDRLEGGTAQDADRAVHRVLVNVNKFVTSITASTVVHQGIELLGGNGTIEDFSPLPRLYRDAIVYESWEGTHNVLCAQIARDATRLDLLSYLFAWARAELARAGESSGSDGVAVAEVLEAIEPELVEVLSRGNHGAAGFRRRIVRLARVIQACCLLSEAADAPSTRSGSADSKVAIASLFIRHHLIEGYDPEGDPQWLDLVTAALGDDAA